MLPGKLLLLAWQRFEWLTQLCPKFETSQEQSILIQHHQFSNLTNPQTKQRQSIDIKQLITYLNHIIIQKYGCLSRYICLGINLIENHGNNQKSIWQGVHHQWFMIQRLDSKNEGKHDCTKREERVAKIKEILLGCAYFSF